MSSQVITKKVSPYPFPVKLVKGAQIVTGQVAKLTTKGLLLHTPAVLSVGSQYEIEFDLPAERGHVKTQCKIVKTYDSVAPAAPAKKEDAAAAPPPNGPEPYQPPGVKRVNRIVELHFMQLGAGNENCITGFLKAIRQREQ